MAKILNKAITTVRVVMQTIMTSGQSLLNSTPMIWVPMYAMSISARAIVTPAARKIKSENRQDIRTTYRLYRSTFPLLILLAVMPIRFMKTFYHYRDITQGLGPYLPLRPLRECPGSFRHADGDFALAQPPPRLPYGWQAGPSVT